MIKGFDPMAERFLASLNLLQQRAERAQRQITSGLKSEIASDAPGGIRDILDIRSRMSRTEQVANNLSRAKAEAAAADNALQTAAGILDRVTVLGSEAAGTLAADRRPALALEMRQLLQELVNLSALTVEGRYVFSGDADHAPSYRFDEQGQSGVERLQPQQSTRLIQHPAGDLFGISKTAQEIFDKRNADDSAAASNVFAAVHGLLHAVEANDETGMKQHLGLLQQASDHVNGMAAQYGIALNRITSAIDTAEKFQVQWTGELSEKQDADLPAAIVTLTQSNTSLEAALAAQSKTPRTSLFDFLR